jgi:hypothetical protein
MSGYGRSGRGFRTGRARVPRWVIVVVVLVLVLLGLDFGTKAIAESVAASEIQKQGHIHVKPDVTFAGFPFLAQLLTRDFHQVSISIANLPEGPVTFTKVSATATAVKPTSFTFKSMTIGHLTGTVLIDFGSLGNTLTSQFGALGTLLNGAGLNLTDAGPQEVKATLDLVITSGSATWRITRAGPHELDVRLVASSGLPSSLLSSLQSLRLRIPPLPLGLTLNRVSVTPAGVVGTISGSNVTVGS